LQSNSNLAPARISVKGAMSERERSSFGRNDVLNYVYFANGVFPIAFGGIAGPVSGALEIQAGRRLGRGVGGQV
jgi:hypothetical protein